MKMSNYIISQSNALILINNFTLSCLFAALCPYLCYSVLLPLPFFLCPYLCSPLFSLSVPLLSPFFPLSVPLRAEASCLTRKARGTKKKGQRYGQRKKGRGILPAKLEQGRKGKGRQRQLLKAGKASYGGQRKKRGRGYEQRYQVGLPK